MCVIWGADLPIKETAGPLLSSGRHRLTEEIMQLDSCLRDDKEEGMRVKETGSKRKSRIEAVNKHYKSRSDDGQLFREYISVS